MLNGFIPSVFVACQGIMKGLGDASRASLPIDGRMSGKTADQYFVVGGYFILEFQLDSTQVFYPRFYFDDLLISCWFVVGNARFYKR